jgi:DNA-binding response OmpR family regulator
MAVWGTKRKAPMPKQQHSSSIAILQDATGRLALFVNGQHSNRGGKGQLAVMACLLDNLGRAIPYKRLFTVIGRKSDSSYNRHLLRQYMLVLREMLLEHKAPLVIATVNDSGTRFAKSPKIRAILRGLSAERTWRNWGETCASCASQQG